MPVVMTEESDEIARLKAENEKLKKQLENRNDLFSIQLNQMKEEWDKVWIVCQTEKEEEWKETKEAWSTRLRVEHGRKG